ncbi:hypothetical protein JCM19992_03490 [Thermostilla marina]
MPKFEIACPSCNAKHLVDLKQAGTSLACPCGNTVDIPARSKLLASETIVVDKADAPERETKPASIRFLLLAGAALLLAAAAIGGVYVWATWPTPEPMSHMYPLDAFNYWVHVRQGIDADLFVIEKRWADTLALYRGYRTALLILAGIGLLLGILGFVLPTGEPPLEIEEPQDEPTADAPLEQ